MAKPTEKQRHDARREFYRIVAERLEARIERGEAYTTTRDLYKGYEPLHQRGFGDQPPSQSVAQVLAYKRFRDRLYYARHVVTHKPERSGPGRAAPSRIYLRADATPPVDHVLVPITAKGDEIGEYIAHARGVADAAPHAFQAPAPVEAPEAPPARATLPEITVNRDGIDFEAVAEALTGVIEAQARVIDTLIPALKARVPVRCP